MMKIIFTFVNKHEGLYLLLPFNIHHVENVNKVIIFKINFYYRTHVHIGIGKLRKRVN